MFAKRWYSALKIEFSTLDKRCRYSGTFEDDSMENGGYHSIGVIDSSEHIDLVHQMIAGAAR